MGHALWSNQEKEIKQYDNKVSVWYTQTRGLPLWVRCNYTFSHKYYKTQKIKKLKNQAADLHEQPTILLKYLYVYTYNMNCNKTASLSYKYRRLIKRDYNILIHKP